ncbi:MAG: RNA polymerase sigma-54 factor, partial [Akkermansiaceae bacterium]|nr:RNA polymerase sigma-54 factor [Akkermansiaceae bacterium]
MSDVFLHQSLSQQQTLAPQMRKSLEILQAGTMELSQIISQALEINPVLEDITETISLDEEAPDPEEVDSLDYLNETDDDWRDRNIMEGKSSPWTNEDEERRQRLYDSIVAPMTLQQHLQQQLDLSMVDPEVREAAQAILGNLDARGFLDLPAKELGIRMGIKPRDLEKALKLIQSFDPAGVGASGIAESLLFQLERQTGKETIEYKIVRDHLEDLARKRHPQIAKALGTSVERVAEAASRIGRLTPNPGGDFDPTGNPYILPDVIISRNDDGILEAKLTGEHLPNLRINDFYKDMIGKNGVDSKARQ